MPEYIQARPRQEGYRKVGPYGFYHGLFRGFGAEPHAHGYLQVLVPLQGRMHLVAGDEDHLLGPEWAVVLPPDLPHGFTHVDGELEFLAIDGPWAFVQEVAAELGGTSAAPDRPLVVREPQLWWQARQMAAEVETPRPGGERVLRAGLEQVGVYFLRAMARPADAPLAEEPRVLRAVDRVLRDFREDLGVADMAAEVAMSPRHFERCFKEALGVTPKQYLIGVRIGAARELLSTTERPVTDIALEVGFKNPSHFAETFLRHVGSTPSAYRVSQRPAL